MSKNIHDKITDHAVIRYLERVMDIDIDMIKSKIVCEKTLAKIKKFENAKPFHIRKDDCVLRIVNGKVVTVLNRKGSE